MRYLALDGCAVSRPMYGVLRHLKREAGFGLHDAVYDSIYRGNEPGVVHILHAHGKHTQQEVIDLHAQGVPGYGPANSVTTTTHCCFNDGVAYPNRPVGAHLPWWCCGFDVPDLYVVRMERAAARIGWHVHRPYSSGSEYHHLNFSQRPGRWRIIYDHLFSPHRHTGGTRA